jgi:hypothetical protein
MPKSALLSVTKIDRERKKTIRGRAQPLQKSRITIPSEISFSILSLPTKRHLPTVCIAKCKGTSQCLKKIKTGITKRCGVPTPQEKNARETKKEFFAVPRYLARRVLGNNRTPTRTQHAPLRVARSSVFWPIISLGASPKWLFSAAW